MNITAPVISFSLLEKIVVLQHGLELDRSLTLEDGIGEGGVLLLEDFELPLDLVPRLGHLGGDHGEITPVPLHQLDQGGDLRFRPVGRGILFGGGFNDFLLFLHPILESDLIDEGLERGN